jgi:ABC-type antimicrobial peptide transport system permease subunit
MRPVIAGAAAGIAIALSGARLLDALLFGVAAIDPLSFAAAAASLAAVSAVAAWLPARRASTADPVAALRQ